MSNEWWVGVDIGGSKFLLVATDESRRKEHWGRTGAAVRPIDIEREIRDFLTHLDGTTAALGIAVPGLVDAGGGIIACDVLPRLAGWCPRETFLDLCCPMQVLNDAEAALLEETHDLSPEATAGLVMAGTAIGAAF
ncbi:MAG TPA: ROK family protein, partial [Candidatus Binatia bacterium]|nr:ROK family protein [Candidatus Binatia bacterium]